MAQDNQNYYRLRSDQARQHAELAASEKIKFIHLEMAERYALLAGSGDPIRQTPHI